MDKTTDETEELSFKDKHSFVMFIFLSIFIAFSLVIISMAMYNSSGAAQLDLSRPGYVSVRSQVDATSDDLQTYSASGSIDQNTITEFKTLFSKQSQKAKAIDAFGSDPLNPDALGIGTTTVTVN